jgi:dipeptidyl aminopeptidase/acylaminoacyl peptidase
MTTERRLERDLPQILGDLAMGPYPDYIDDVLATTAQRRQRAAWTFPERWLPMVDLARQPVLMPRLPWRMISLALLMIALLVAAAAALIGTQPRSPEPFGVARNGLVAYSADGDIYTVDPVTGVVNAIVSGASTDLAPQFSLDGTHIAFERMSTPSSPGQLYVARSDGSELVLVTPEALADIDSYAFSANGREILISAGLALHIANSDGSGIRTLPIGNLLAEEPDYSAPDGGEIVFIGRTSEATASGLYVIQPDGSGLRTLVEPSNLGMVDPRWSPDGSRIAYSAYALDYATGGSLLRVYVVGADGRSNRLLRILPEKDLENAAGWSNDGTRLLIEGCYDIPSDDTADCVTAYSVIPVDREGPVVELDIAAAPAGVASTWHVWAPDDQAILTVPINSAGRPLSTPLLSDPVTGRSVPWTGPNVGSPSWQRLAP